MLIAIDAAKLKAISQAKSFFETEDVVQDTQFRLDVNCKKSIYSNSTKERSWIVQVFAKFSKKKIYISNASDEKEALSLPYNFISNISLISN